MLPPRHVLLAGLLLAAGCGPGADHVELRLFACAIEAMSPRSAILVIRQYDAAGLTLGDPLEEAYTIPDGAFDDMFATVHYRPAAGTATADFTVHWFAAELPGAKDQADLTLFFPGEVVPARGRHLSLDGMCPDGGSGTGTTTGTTAGTTAGTGSGTTTATTSSTGGTTSTTGSSTSSTVSTSGATGSTGTTGGTTGSTGTTGGMSGMPCGMPDSFYCEGLDADGKGLLLQCVIGTWTPAVLGTTCTFCDTGDMPIGCVTEGIEWACLCQSVAPPACTQAVNGCAAGTLTLCVQGEEATADCVNACMYTDPGDYTCN